MTSVILLKEREGAKAANVMQGFYGQWRITPTATLTKSPCRGRHCCLVVYNEHEMHARWTSCVDFENGMEKRGLPSSPLAKICPQFKRIVSRTRLAQYHCLLELKLKLPLSYLPLLTIIPYENLCYPQIQPRKVLLLPTLNSRPPWPITTRNLLPINPTTRSPTSNSTPPHTPKAPSPAIAPPHKHSTVHQAMGKRPHHTREADTGTVAMAEEQAQEDSE